MTVRTRLAGKVSLLGGVFFAAMTDLVLWLDPRIGDLHRLTYRPRPWLGVLFIALLGLGAGQVGVLAIEMVHYAVSRVERQGEP